MLVARPRHPMQVSILLSLTLMSIAATQQSAPATIKFESAENKLSFSYPSSWKRLETPKGAIAIILVNPDHKESESNEVCVITGGPLGPNDSRNIDALVDQQVDTFRQRFTGLKIIERKNGTVNGARACRVLITGESQQGALKVATEVLLRDE